MQRVKGHGNQGGVRNGTENNEHENVNSWAHQSYNAANASMASAYSLSNYYGASYHYPTYCMGDGANSWPSNDAITYVGNYNGQIAPEAAAAYGMDGSMFSTAAAFGTPYTQPTAAAAAPTSFNYFPGATAEYQATWNAGTASMPPAAVAAAKQYEEFYRENMYDGVDALKGIDHRLQSLDIAATAAAADTNSNKMTDPRYCYGVQRNDTYASSTTTAACEKKTTWASIAKQPAKPIPPTSSGGSKKKGPGMPPPPMVPGRHIDLNTWEPKNNHPPKIPVAPLPPPSASGNSLAQPVWNGPILTTEAAPTVTAAPEMNSHYEPAAGMTASLPPPPVYPAPSSASQSVAAAAATAPAAPSPPQPQSKPFTTSRPPPQQHQQHQQQPTVYQQPAAPARAPAVSAPPPQSLPPPPQSMTASAAEVFASSSSLSSTSSAGGGGSSSPPHSVVEKLRDKNNYNPCELELPPKGTRFFVIKSYSEDDVHRSIKYEIWCSTEHGNKRLDDAFNDQSAKNGAVYLFFSVNGSGHFCGMARMISPVDYGASSSVWAQDKWKGQFKVRWIYVKDVPNPQLRHIRLENNENKPVTNSRDTQEVPYDKGVSVLKIIHAYTHKTSIFDDFTHYEKRQEEGDSNKRGPPPSSMHQGGGGGGGSGSGGGHYHQLMQQHHGGGGGGSERRNPFGGRSMHSKDRDRDGAGRNSYSHMNMNHDNRRGGGGRSNGSSFTNQRNYMNALHS